MTRMRAKLLCGSNRPHTASTGNIDEVGHKEMASNGVKFSAAKPKHAWWRDLLATPGVEQTKSTSRSGRQRARLADFDSVTSSVSTIDPIECFESSQGASSSASSSPSGAYSQASPQQSPTSSICDTAKESDHLAWAKQVRASSSAWFRQHLEQVELPVKHTPRPGSKARQDAFKHRRNMTPLPLQQCWEDSLRDDQGSDIKPADWQEKKFRKRRKECNLQRLKDFQQKWRKQQQARTEPAVEAKEAEDGCHVPGKVESAKDDLPSLSATPSAAAAKSARSATPHSKAPRILSKLHSGQSNQGTPAQACTAEASGTQADTSNGLALPRPPIATKIPASSQSPLHSRTLQALRRVPSPARSTSPGSKREAAGEKSLTPVAKGWKSLRQAHTASQTRGMRRLSAMLKDPRSTTSPSQRSTLSVKINATDADCEWEHEWDANRHIIRPQKRRFCLKKDNFGQLQEWRKFFPLDVLDEIANIYEEIPPEAIGTRILTPSALEPIATILGIPPQSFLMQVASILGAEVLDDFANVLLYSLAELLAIARAAIDHMEALDPGLLWPLEDLFRIEGVFTQHANSHGLMPVEHLFTGISELGLPELVLETVEQQQWLAGITKQMFTEQHHEHKNDVKGCMSFREFLQVVTTALKTKERDQRAQDFKIEWETAYDAEISIVQLEDFRMLYQHYLSFADDGRVDGSSSIVAHLLTMFSECGDLHFRKDEALELREIVSETADIYADGKVPFVTFLKWMKLISERGLGGLRMPTNNGSIDEPPPQHKKGFVAVFLREAAQKSGEAPPVESSTSDASCPQVKPADQHDTDADDSDGDTEDDEDHEKPPERRRSITLLHSMGSALPPVGASNQRSIKSIVKKTLAVGKLTHEVIENGHAIKRRLSTGRASLTPTPIMMQCLELNSRKSYFSDSRQSSKEEC